MREELNIPDEVLGAFRRIQRSLPEHLRNNSEFLEKILGYLKLGGDKLARQCIELIQKPFEQEFVLVKRRSSDESSEEDEDSEESEDSEDEDTDID